MRLGQCTEAIAGDAGCQMDTTSVSSSTTALRGQLDQCSMEGVAVEDATPVPGVTVSSALAAGRCVSSADCGSADLM